MNGDAVPPRRSAASPPGRPRLSPKELLITSPQNEKLKLVRKLADRRWRDKLGLFVCEREDLVEAARDAGITPVELLVAGEDVDADLLAGVSTMAHPPRVIAVYRRADLPQGFRDRVLTLWRVADPGNVGTLIRAADVFDASIALSSGCADPTGPKALRASAGAVFRVPLGSFDEAAGPRVALVAHGGEPLPEIDLRERTTFVLGAEREGLPDEVLQACDERATIPQSASAESLNVAMAGTIALYELARRFSSASRR